MCRYPFVATDILVSCLRIADALIEFKDLPTEQEDEDQDRTVTKVPTNVISIFLLQSELDLRRARAVRRRSASKYGTYYRKYQLAE